MSNYIKLDNLEVIVSSNSFGDQIIEIRRILTQEQLQAYFDMIWNQRHSAEDCKDDRVLATFINPEGNWMNINRTTARELVKQVESSKRKAA